MLALNDIKARCEGLAQFFSLRGQTAVHAQIEIKRRVTAAVRHAKSSSYN